MKIQNNGQKTLESRSMRSKIKEIAAISVFIVAAAIASIILANIIVFPLTHFAIKNVDIFNLIFNNFILIIILVFLIYKFIIRYRKLADEGLKAKEILLYFVKRPFYYAGLSLSFIVISALMIFVLYLLFSLNYYYLYEISGGV